MKVIKAQPNSINLYFQHRQRVADANRIANMGKISATNPNDFKQFCRNFEKISITGLFSAGGYTISKYNSHVPIKYGLQAHVSGQPQSIASLLLVPI